MLISALTPELQELVHKRQEEAGNDGKFNGMLSAPRREGNFTWYNTPEGFRFWSSVNDGKNVTTHKMYPNRKIINNYETT